MFLFQVLLPVLLYVGYALAYIPATPTNKTEPIDLDDESHITLKFKSFDPFNDVILMLLRSNSSEMAQGALVRFSEGGLTTDITTTPWIALVNCDANATDSSTSVDIFTLARERGAKGAILYSQNFDTCEISDGFSDSDPPLDVYMPQNNVITQNLLSQFNHLLNASYMDYDPILLNQSQESVQASLSSTSDTSDFIIATLTPDSSITNNTNANGTDTTPPQHTNNPNTGLAMIILYAITGCVSVLFIVVILSGAIRAIRHPERYGPRAPGVNGRGLPFGGQTRTGGLGRAILDTIPVIKFNQISPVNTSTPRKYDLEHSPVELSPRSPIEDSKDEKKRNDFDGHFANEEFHPSTPSSSKGPTSGDPEPSAMGRQTCPICIVDFEKDDDVRVLPCEGKHQFHQACVDPWLLELSSSCPLCREDFHALEAVLSGGREPEENSTEQAGRSHRFTGYLRFARRRRNMISRTADGESPW